MEGSHRHGFHLGMAFILAWPLLLGLKVTHRPKVNPQCSGGKRICLFGLETMALLGGFSILQWKTRLSQPEFVSS